MANLARVQRAGGSSSAGLCRDAPLATGYCRLRRRAHLLVAYPFIDQALGFRLMGALLPIGIYALLAMGLNIVVGYAGLLDLGYAAFFAIGAYTVGFLTSPASSSSGLA